MKKLLFLITLVLPMFAFAISLSEARSAKLVAENDHGYLVSLSNTKEVEQLVNEVNSKRRAEYEKIASNTAASLAEVEQISAEKILSTLAPGSKIIINGQLSEQ